MSTLDVIAEILREVAPRALKAREIAELAKGRLSTTSRTPETVVRRDLAMEVKRHGAASRFLRAAPGEFLLKEALPTAFYNDVESYAAQWTRNLIEAGELAPGVVDERSIRDIKPADVASYRQCHFFSGIGVWSRALRDAGWPDAVNVWSGSCPCQNFSSAGKREGFAGNLHLWPEWFRLIAACRPAVVVGEQVSSKDGLAWFDLVLANLEGADYAVRAIDIPAASVGAPHRRQRLYFAAYARERGREILSAPWLHARRQPGYDALGRGAPDGRGTSTVSDAAGARSCAAEDARADSGDANAGTEAHERGTTGDLELERGGEADGAELDRRSAGELGDACLDGVGEHGRELSCNEAQHDEWSTQGDHAPILASAAYRPGDRVRIVGDPTWGGAVAGFWAEDVEWVYCRPVPGHENGCFRPAESGTLALVNGPAPGVGRTRTKRLKCFGNAIVLPQAVAFVGAVIDALVDARASAISSVVEGMP